MAHTTNSKRKLPRLALVLVMTCCSLLIAGCTGFEAAKPPGPPPGCQGANCDVNVFVGDNCSLSVDPPTLHVPRPNPDVHHIRWTIQTGGYHFPQDGITIKLSGSGVDPDPGVLGDPTKFVMIDRHTRLGLIPYGVRVLRNSDGMPCTLDPMISNE